MHRPIFAKPKPKSFWLCKTEPRSALVVMSCDQRVSNFRSHRLSSFQFVLWRCFRWEIVVAWRNREIDASSCPVSKLNAQINFQFSQLWWQVQPKIIYPTEFATIFTMTTRNWSAQYLSQGLSLVQHARRPLIARPPPASSYNGLISIAYCQHPITHLDWINMIMVSQAHWWIVLLSFCHYVIM